MTTIESWRIATISAGLRYLVFRLQVLSLCLVTQFALVGQPPAVTEVYNAVTYDARLSPGSRAVVKHRLGSNDFDTVVEVGGRRAIVLAVAGVDALGIQLPMELAPGATTLVVTSRGVSTAPFPITLDPVAPAIISSSGIHCPAVRAGDASVGAVGLGATDPMIAAGAMVPPGPLPSTVLRPSITIAGRPAEVTISVLSRGRNEGFYQVTFRVPPETPVGRHRLDLTIGGHTATESLRVASATTAMAAAWREGRAAPESIMSAYACAAPLASSEVMGDRRNPQMILGGTTVTVKDSAGIERPAPILYASPRQVNYVMPSGTSSGTATVTITSGNGVVSTAIAEVATVEPELFVAGNYPAALLMRVRDGQQTIEPVIRTVNGQIEQVPIDMGAPTDELFLLLFGTGLRNRSALENVKVRIGRMELPAEYAGPQGEFAGLDQINVRLPGSLVGPDYCCFLELYLVVDGKFANNNVGLFFKE